MGKEHKPTILVTVERKTRFVQMDVLESMDGRTVRKTIMLYPVDDFRELSQRDVSKIARLLNARPRKTLDFRTPYEVLS
jgi:IS30 family transposase